MIQPILIYGNPILEQACAEITDFTSRETDRVIKDLLDTCHATVNSAGLAAPQIGVLKRVIVVRTAFDRDDMDTYMVLINPRIVSQSGRSEEREGCLSIPGHIDKVARPDSVLVRYQDVFSEIQTIKGTGFLARTLVHEIDHLDGRLFIHYFGGAYCVAVEEWLGRQMEKPVEQKIPAISSDPAADAPEKNTEEAYQPFEASFIQAERPEDDLSDETSGEMAERDI